MKETKDGQKEPLVPFMNRGNFRPVKHEQSYQVKGIEFGQVPKDINGTFLKNGPNPQFEDTELMRSHWFAGDGMLHGFMLQDGKLFYCNRYTQTKKYIKEKKAGKHLIPNLSDMTESGVFLLVIYGLKRKIGYETDLPKRESYTANTALAQHAQRTFALVEADLPFQVKIEGQKDNLEIKSLGYDDFEGQLKHACSAHPKVDRKTKEFLVFSYDIERGLANYSLFDGKRKLKNHFKIPLLSPRMIHDFAMTEKFAIVPDLPLELDPAGAIKHKRFIFNLNKSAPARYGIWPRNSKDGKDIKWFEVEPHYVFHIGGQWDSVNDKGEEIVTLYVVTHPIINIGFQFIEHYFKIGNLQTFDKYEFNLTTLKAKKTTLIDNMYMEFPNLN